jgi:hypothetical protein
VAPRGAPDNALSRRNPKYASGRSGERHELALGLAASASFFGGVSFAAPARLAGTATLLDVLRNAGRPRAGAAVAAPLLLTAGLVRVLALLWFDAQFLLLSKLATDAKLKL